MRRSGALTGAVEVDVDQAVVTLVGEVRAPELPLLHALLAAATTATGGVTVDVAGVLELERSGVAALQQSASRLRVEGRRASSASRRRALERCCGRPLPRGGVSEGHPALPGATSLRREDEQQVPGYAPRVPAQSSLPPTAPTR